MIRTAMTQLFTIQHSIDNDDINDNDEQNEFNPVKIRSLSLSSSSASANTSASLISNPISPTKFARPIGALLLSFSIFVLFYGK